MNFSFEQPLVLFVGIIGLAIAFIASRILRSSSAVEVPLGPPGGTSFVPPVGADLAVRAFRTLEILGTLSLAVAAAGPVFVSVETVWLERGADVMFIVDCSPSMSARDMGTAGRFETARSLVRDFSKSRGADAIGLVAVGADAALLVPPTVDRTTLLSRLETLSIGEFGDGTALGLGLSIAALHLRSSTAPRKAAILITDGENNAGEIHPVTAAAALGSANASLWVVGVGGAGEVEIDYVDPTTKIRRTGVLDSRFDPQSLRAIARAGGGTYLAAPSADAFARAFARVDADETTSVLSRSRSRTESVYAPFILAGIALLVLARIGRRLILGSFL